MRRRRWRRRWPNGQDRPHQHADRSTRAVRRDRQVHGRAECRRSWRTASTSAEPTIRSRSILKDTESDPTRAAQLTQEVIDGGVDVVIPGFTPDITNAVGDTAEANGVPMVGWACSLAAVVLREARTSLRTTVYEWQYHFFWGLEDIIPGLPRHVEPGRHEQDDRSALAQRPRRERLVEPRDRLPAGLRRGRLHARRSGSLRERHRRLSARRSPSSSRAAWRS